MLNIYNWVLSSFVITLVFLNCGKCILGDRNRSSLKNGRSVRQSNINNRQLISLNLVATSICDKTLTIRIGNEVAVKMRPKPKGSCFGCCNILNSDIQFKLYTKDEPETPIFLPPEKHDNEIYPYLNKDTKVIIYVHGFYQITEAGGSVQVKNAYFQREEDYTVILVDWSELVSFPWYIHAAINVKIAGLTLAKFLESYSDSGSISMRNVHLIGFSLGAQVVGFAGKYLRKDLRITRITGLDPAYPIFHAVNEEYRLNPNDADFIDVIHTDGGSFGFPIPVGHVDFFPNGGTYYQPGCDYKHLIKIGELDIIGSCSHRRAYKYYAESVISPYSFPAIKCNVNVYGFATNCDSSDVVYMGFAANNRYSGSYFLTTKKDSPYGRGDTTT